MRKSGTTRKITDETNVVGCACGVDGVIREEVWVNESDQVVKYNLAFINQALCSADNGRVLGYDNAHGYHERHWMGASTEVKFSSYEDTLSTFIDEADRLRRKK